MALTLAVWICAIFVAATFAQTVERLDIKIDVARARAEQNALELARHQALVGHPGVTAQLDVLAKRMNVVETWMNYSVGGAVLFTFLITVLQVLNLFGVRFRVGRGTLATIGSKPNKETDHGMV